MSIKHITLVLFIVSPLIYSAFASFRFYASLALAIVAIVFWIGNAFRPNWAEILFLSLYILTLLIQPLYVAGVWETLVIGHAIFILAMFVPAWAIRCTSARQTGLEWAAEKSMTVLFLVTVVSIYLSYFFNIGEVVEAGSNTRRAFAWLGDRFSPVITLLIIFYVMQKSWVRVAALVAALLMTGGKSATLLLVSAPILYAAISPMRLGKRFFIMLSIVLVGIFGYFGLSPVFGHFFPGADWAFNSRFLANQVGIEYFLNNPWFGVGVDQSIYSAAYEMETVIQTYGIEAYTMPRIHNAFIRTAAETGIFGLIALLGLCLIWSVRCVKIVKGAYWWPHSMERNFVISSAIWCFGFIWIYQTVDWFMGGEIQLAFLLIFLAVSETVIRRNKRARCTTR